MPLELVLFDKALQVPSVLHSIAMHTADDQATDLGEHSSDLSDGLDHHSLAFPVLDITHDTYKRSLERDTQFLPDRRGILGRTKALKV
jgi:hypothetical protein